MKLNGIRELLDAWDRGDGLADVLGVTNALATALSVIPEATGSTDQFDAYPLSNPHCADLAGRLAAGGLDTAAPGLSPNCRSLRPRAPLRPPV